VLSDLAMVNARPIIVVCSYHILRCGPCCISPAHLAHLLARVLPAVWCCVVLAAVDVIQRRGVDAYAERAQPQDGITSPILSHGEPPVSHSVPYTPPDALPVRRLFGLLSAWLAGWLAGALLTDYCHADNQSAAAAKLNGVRGACETV
jgi:hypothetical protein